MQAIRRAPSVARSARLLSTESDIYDVAIVGGGMVGMSLAAALGANTSTQALRVAVLDRAPVQDVLDHDIRHPPDYRVSTVVESSIRFLEQSDAWSHMAPLAREFSSMQVWDTVGRGCLQWEGADLGRARMGAVVENSVVQSACYRVAKASPNVSFMWPSTISEIAFPPYSHKPSSTSTALASENSEPPYGSLASITCTTTPAESLPSSSTSSSTAQQFRSFQARLIVAADGPRSQTRARAGLRTMSHAYDQRGLVATVATEQHSTAWQRFLPTGPIALLPTRSGYSNIVWSTSPAHAAELAHMAPDKFGHAVNDALSLEAVSPEIPGGISDVLSRVSTGASQPRTPPRVEGWVGQPPASFPLSMQHAGRYVRPRLALIGDAAHVVHPLAGQGVNLGFGDAAALYEAIAATVAIGGDIGDMRVLQDEFERPRMAVNVAMSAALHALHSVFAVADGPVAQVRSAGMALLNTAPPLRNELMRVAMGDGPEPQPELLQGLLRLFPQKSGK